MEARPDGREREIHYEETTWKARPDWSRDGRRVVYSSYLGRQWNQLWLMTSDGGDPLQLTYGEFDATAPRWSPDGRRIAYVSNEGGNTSLWIVDAARGHQRKEIRTERRHPLRPMRHAAYRGEPSSGGSALPARVSVRGERWPELRADRCLAPRGRRLRSRRAAASSTATSTRHGSSTLTAPGRAVQVEVSRGPEYRVVEPHGRSDGGRRDTPARRRSPVVDDLEGRGWYSGDLHVHMNYGGAYRNDPRDSRSRPGRRISTWWRTSS